MSGEKLSNNELVVIKNDVLKVWKRIVGNPEVLTDMSEQELVFAAGGGLVKQFGKSKSEIWQRVVERGGRMEGRIKIAGIDFGVSELAVMGDFYRFLEEKEFNFHCIDERLEGDEACLENEVHCKCGACAAVGAAAGLESVEDSLLSELNQRVKQDIYSDLPNHESMVILVDFCGSDVVLGDERKELKGGKALPFNVSLPLGKVREWAGQGNGRDAKALVRTMVKWNVQIARNIIGGDHNGLQQLAGETIIVVDNRDVENGDGLVDMVMEALKKVEHGKFLLIE